MGVPYFLLFFATPFADALRYGCCATYSGTCALAEPVEAWRLSSKSELAVPFVFGPNRHRLAGMAFRALSMSAKNSSAQSSRKNKGVEGKSLTCFILGKNQTS